IILQPLVERTPGKSGNKVSRTASRVPFWDVARTTREYSNDVRVNWRYALRMSRYRNYGVATAAIALAAIYALQPGLRHFLWPAIAWSIFIMSAIVAVAVVCNILVVLYHMFFGYIPEEERFFKQAST